MNGLLPLPKDKRDFNLSDVLGMGKYEPKSVAHSLIQERIHKQKYNTCGWVATTAGKEIDENCTLSARSLVIAGYQKGYIEGDGFSTLRNVEKTLQGYGIAEQDYCQEESKTWDGYVDEKYYGGLVKDNAIKHRSDSYWRIHTLEDALKALDSDRPIKIGIEWDSGWDIIEAPYILYKCNSQWGHAMLVTAYDTETRLFKVINSFGEEWGDEGVCYIRFEDFEEMIKVYGAYCNLDVSPEKVEELIAYKSMSIWQIILDKIIKLYKKYVKSNKTTKA